MCSQRSAKPLPVLPWQADLGVPPEFCRLLRSNTLGVCVMNQRRFVRWSAGADNACEVVLPARIMMSNSASALFAAVDDVVPAVCLERLKQLCEKAPASVACCRSALASAYGVDEHRRPRQSQSQRLAPAAARVASCARAAAKGSGADASFVLSVAPSRLVAVCCPA
jgi:hypothetical protein